MNSITAQNTNERLMVYPVSGDKIMPGKGTVAPDFEQIYSLAFTSHYLLAGEWAPHYELFSPDGGSSLAWTALDAPPYNIDGGNLDLLNIPASILCLGSRVYMGFSASPILQATDGPGTKGFMINAAHPSLSVGNSQAMAGYLLTVDRPPVLYHIGNKTVQVGHLLKFTVSARDPNAGDSLRYSASNLPRGATFNATTHTFKWTPNSRQVSVHRGVTFTATDNHRKSDSEVISITVRKRR